VQLDENQWFSNPHYLGSPAHEKNPPNKPDFAFRANEPASTSSIVKERFSPLADLLFSFGAS
jgi:hypothetical protein